MSQKSSLPAGDSPERNPCAPVPAPHPGRSIREPLPPFRLRDDAGILAVVQPLPNDWPIPGTVDRFVVWPSNGPVCVVSLQASLSGEGEACPLWWSCSCREFDRDHECEHLDWLVASDAIVYPNYVPSDWLVWITVLPAPLDGKGADDAR